MRRALLPLLLFLLIPHTASANGKNLILEMVGITEDIMELSEEILIITSKRFPWKKPAVGANVEKEGGITATLQVFQTNLVHTQISMNQILKMYIEFIKLPDASQGVALGALANNELKRIEYSRTFFRLDTPVIDVMEDREKALCLKGMSLIDSWLEKYDELKSVRSIK